MPEEYQSCEGGQEDQDGQNGQGCIRPGGEAGGAQRRQTGHSALTRPIGAAQARIDELQAFADTDFLLDIPNRRGFERELNRSISFIKRYRASGALIVLDVDRLKPINDTYGHAAGDQVLKAIVGELLGHVRASDVIGRLGGDEFALLLWNLSETDARAKAALLEQAIDRLTFSFRGRTITAGASAGIAILGPSRRSRQSPRRGRPRDVCAQGATAARNDRESRARLLQRDQIIRHVAEFSQHLRVAEFADHGIAGAAERDRADAARASR